MCSESSTGCWAILQLPCCPSKEGELTENIEQNLFYKLPLQTVAADRKLPKSACWTNKLNLQRHFQTTARGPRHFFGVQVNPLGVLSPAKASGKTDSPWFDQGPLKRCLNWKVLETLIQSIKIEQYKFHILPEIRSDHLTKFHSFADEVAAVKPVTETRYLYTI